MDDMPMISNIFTVIWSSIGIAFFLTGIIMLFNIKNKKKKYSVKAHGKVVDIVKKEYIKNDDANQVVWYPVIEYNVGDLKFKSTSDYGDSPNKYEIGQEIEVFCNPDNYNQYYIKGNTTPNFLAKMFTIFGLVSIIIAIISAIFKF